MAYTDLLVTPLQTSLSDTCTQAIFTDDTGEFPAVSTGFSANGSGTATRPSYNQVNVFYIARRANADGTWTEYIPDTQGFTWEDPQWILPLLDGDGNAYADAPWEIVELVFPVATSWASLIELGLDFTELVELADTDGAYGQVGLYVNCTSTACVNDARRRLDNKFPANCSQEELQIKQALMQSGVDNITLGQALDAIADDTTTYYVNAAVIIDALLTQCLNEGCLCNC